MTKECYEKLVKRLRDQDSSLTDVEISQVAEQAVKLGAAEVQQATVFHPNAGVEMARIYMKMAENPGNAIYGLRLELARSQQANPCTLEILAQVATEFADEELRQAIEANPVTTEKIRAILRKA